MPFSFGDVVDSFVDAVFSVVDAVVSQHAFHKSHPSPSNTAAIAPPPRSSLATRSDPMPTDEPPSA